jgi:hypothetical protein
VLLRRLRVRPPHGRYPVKPTFVSLSNAPKKVPDARDLLKTTDAESTEEEKDATGSGAPPAKRPRV